MAFGNWNSRCGGYGGCGGYVNVGYSFFGNTEIADSCFYTSVADNEDEERSKILFK